MKLSSILSRLLRGKKAKPPPVDRELILSLVPIRNPAIKWRRYRSGEVALMIPLKRRGLMGRIDKSTREKKVILDRIGSYVWSLCDGEHTFKEIVESLMENYKLHRREAEASLAKYFETLRKRGFISFLPQKVSALKEGGGVKQET